MNYCRASFEILTRIRQMAPLLYIINFRKLHLRVKNETTFISAKNRVDLSSISEVRNYVTEWPRFLAHPVYLNHKIVAFIGLHKAKGLACFLECDRTRWQHSLVDVLR